MNELITRVLVAIIAIPLMIVIVLFGKAPLVILVNILVCLGLWEYYKLCQIKIKFFSQGLILLLAFCTTWWVFYQGEIVLLYSIILAFGILGLANIFRKDFASATTRMVHMLYGFVYLALFNFMILIRELEHIKYDDYRMGGYWIWFMFAVIWVCDTAAYFVGKLFGKHKFAPYVSPNKTIEGFIGGLVFGTLAAYVFSLFAFDDIPTIKLVVAGFLISLLGQFADLMESMFKRRAGAKDSSSLIPGHGGILDRFDSTLFALPLLYFIMKFWIYAS